MKKEREREREVEKGEGNKYNWGRVIKEREGCGNKENMCEGGRAGVKERGKEERREEVA